ncbi:MAG: putative rep protein [Cressdnaviricota sp.]|nr:MAG: putative rep protein [Cressdnaviricota sp.]
MSHDLFAYDDEILSDMGIPYAQGEPISFTTTPPPAFMPTAIIPDGEGDEDAPEQLAPGHLVDDTVDENLPVLPDVKEPKRGCWRFRPTAGVLITLPRCFEGGKAKTLDEFYENVLRFVRSCSNVAQFVVGMEPHADGVPHFHAYVEFSGSKDQVCINAAKLWEVLGKHGDLRIGRSRELDRVRMYLYVLKNDMYRELNNEAGTRKARLAELSTKANQKEAASKVSREIAEMLMSAQGGDARAAAKRVLEAYPEKAASAKRFKEAAETIALLMRPEPERKPWRGISVNDDYPNADKFPMSAEDRVAAEQICSWFNLRVNQVRAPIRERQLAIVGPPGTGKTTFLAQLEEYLKVYVPIMDGAWWPGYEPDKTHLMALDEYHGTIQWGTLLKLLDGSSMVLNVKNGQVFKRAITDNHACVIFSNTGPETWYRALFDKQPGLQSALYHPEALDQRRIDVVRISHDFKFYHYIKFN